MSDQSFYETDGRSECSIGGKSRPQAVFSGYWMSLMCIMGDGHSLISYRDEHSSYDQYMNYNFVLFLCSWTHSVGRECSLHAWSWAMLVGLQQTGAGLSMTWCASVAEWIEAYLAWAVIKTAVKGIDGSGVPGHSVLFHKVLRQWIFEPKELLITELDFCSNYWIPMHRMTLDLGVEWLGYWFISDGSAKWKKRQSQLTRDHWMW